MPMTNRELVKIQCKICDTVLVAVSQGAEAKRCECENLLLHCNTKMWQTYTADYLKQVRVYDFELRQWFDIVPTVV